MICFDCSLFKLRRKCFGASCQPRGQVKAHLWVLLLVNYPALQLTPSLAGFTAQITPMLVTVPAVPPRPRWRVRCCSCGSARADPTGGLSQGLPSIHPGKQQRLGLHYTFHTPVTPFYECPGLFWLLDLSSVVPQGKNEYGEPLHEIKGWTVVFWFLVGIFFASCCFCGSWCFTGCQVCLVTCTAVPLGKKVSRMRACVSGQVWMSLLYSFPHPRETVLLWEYDPVTFQQITQNTLVI